MKKLKVRYKKLGKQKVWGFAHSDGLIEIDVRLKSKKHLEVLVHECLHILYPNDSEEDIVTKSVILTNTLWGEKYRRVDESPHPPLQDGSI